MPTVAPAASGRTELPLIDCCAPVVRELIERKLSV